MSDAPTADTSQSVPTRTIVCRWAAEAKVWVITSPDIRGLETEAATIPEGLRQAADLVAWLTRGEEEPK